MRLQAILISAIPLVLAHQRPRTHPARLAEEIEKRAESSGLLGGLLDDDDSNTSSTSIVRQSSSSLRSSTISSVVPISSTRSVSSTSAIVPSPSAGLNSSGVAGNSTASPSALLSANASSTVVSSSTSSDPSPSSSTQHSQSLTTSVDAAGSTIIVTQFFTASAVASISTSSVSSAAATPSSGTSEGGGGISTAAIVGISIAAGVIILTLIGCAMWRMKRRSGDEDEAIRWPELNRHGDSTTHHALPARQTGQHGIETSPLERSLSNSSSIFANSTAPPHSAHHAPAMTLNGSNFGAASSLDYYDEKATPSTPGGYAYSTNYTPHTPAAYEHDVYADTHDAPHSMPADMEDYTCFPPPMQQARSHHGSTGGYDSGSDEGGHVMPVARNMAVANPDHVTYRAA